MPPRVHESEEEAAQRRTLALLGLILVLSLAIAGIVLVRALGKKAQLEDCLMSGRTNCAPIEVPLREPAISRFSPAEIAHALFQASGWNPLTPGSPGR